MRGDAMKLAAAIAVAVFLIPPFVLLVVFGPPIWQTLQDIDAEGSPL